MPATKGKRARSGFLANQIRIESGDNQRLALVIQSPFSHVCLGKRVKDDEVDEGWKFQGGVPSPKFDLW